MVIGGQAGWPGRGDDKGQDRARAGASWTAHVEMARGQDGETVRGGQAGRPGWGEGGGEPDSACVRRHEVDGGGVRARRRDGERRTSRAARAVVKAAASGTARGGR